MRVYLQEFMRVSNTKISIRNEKSRCVYLCFIDNLRFVTFICLFITKTTTSTCMYTYLKYGVR